MKTCARELLVGGPCWRSSFIMRSTGSMLSPGEAYGVAVGAFVAGCIFGAPASLRRLARMSADIRADPSRFFEISRRET